MYDILLNVVRDFVSDVDVINELLFSLERKKGRIAVAYFDRVRFSEILSVLKCDVNYHLTRCT
jgi:hypothetical protein